MPAAVSPESPGSAGRITPPHIYGTRGNFTVTNALDRLRPADVEALVPATRAKTKPAKRVGDEDTEPRSVR